MTYEQKDRLFRRAMSIYAITVIAWWLTLIILMVALPANTYGEVVLGTFLDTLGSCIPLIAIGVGLEVAKVFWGVTFKLPYEKRMEDMNVLTQELMEENYRLEMKLKQIHEC